MSDIAVVGAHCAFFRPTNRSCAAIPKRPMTNRPAGPGALRPSWKPRSNGMHDPAGPYVWVNSVALTVGRRLPVYPELRTYRYTAPSDAMCHKRKSSLVCLVGEQRHKVAYQSSCHAGLPTQAGGIGAWGCGNRRSGLYLRFLGALMSQSIQKKMLLGRTSDCANLQAK